MKYINKTKLKKIISGILAAALVISIFPFQTSIDVYAEEDPYVELTNTLTAQDTFAWTEYDHDNFTDRYAPSIPDHIIYDGRNIKMVGYGYSKYKDFLLINDTENKNSKKTFTFNIQRDGTDWHSMEGGGFLFNASVKNDILSGFCILVTQEGLKLIQINNTNVDSFRNGGKEYVENFGKRLAKYQLSNLYGEHTFKIEVDNTSVSVWDGESIIIDNYTLPDNDYGYGYGPITSHISHSCSQQSYFTFADIVMEEVVIHYIPKKPVELAYTVNEDSSVTLTWIQPEGKANVAGYNIYRDNELIGTTYETSYTDETANALGNFTYYVSTFDTENYTSENSDTVTVDNLSPVAPVLMIDSVGETSAALTWECSDNVGVESYDIYRNDEFVTSITTNSYTDSALEEGTSYTYYVIAYDASGNKSDNSNTITINTGIDETQPVISSISPLNGKYSGTLPIKVTVTDNRSVSSVTIQASIDNSNWEDVAKIDANGKATAVAEYDLDLSAYNDGKFYVRAYAVNSRNISSDVEASPVMEYTIDSSAPATPLGLTINLLNSQIEIRWDLPEDDDTAYYRIYRKTDTDSKFSLIKDNHKYLNYYDTNIELGVNYTYCISAVDSMGNESAMSSEVIGGIADDNVIPEIISIYPENGAVLETSQIVGISAKDNYKLDSIIVECRPANGKWYTVFSEENINNYAKAVQFELDTSSFTTGSYELRAYAHDTAGNTSEYIVGNYTFKECTLSAPVLSAIGEGWRNELSWTMDNTEDLLGYHVYRKNSATGNYSLIASIKNTEYVDSDVTSGKVYYYQVEAVDSRNNYVKSNEISSVPTDNDDILPLADAGYDVMGIADEIIKFNGANSWDNHYIASYEWDFGDGTTGTGFQVSHAYACDGTYDVTLTVTDSAGNSDSHKIKAYIYSDDYGYVQFKTTDTTGKIISGVKIYCEIPGVDSKDFVTDSSGNFKFIAPKGTYDVYFYKNEYLPEYMQITVTGESKVQKISLEKKELV